jgi:hemoglobin
MSRPDIASRGDIDEMLRAFYTEATADPVIGYLFTEVARLDLDAHLPVIGAFWETVLLDRPVYRGNPMRPHQALHALSALRAEHFQRWFAIWAATIDARFDGPVATEAKHRAAVIAETMQRHLGIVSPVESFGPAYRSALGLDEAARDPASC